jgi:hypothetical protein
MHENDFEGYSTPTGPAPLFSGDIAQFSADRKWRNDHAHQPPLGRLTCRDCIPRAGTDAFDEWLEDWRTVPVVYALAA